MANTPAARGQSFNNRHLRQCAPHSAIGFCALGKVVVLYSIVKGTGISQKYCSEIWQPLMARQTIRARKNLKKKEGSAYDVTAQAAPAIQGYTYKVTTGDALTGTLDGNKVITVVYTKDTVDPIKPDPVKPEPTKPADTPNTGDSSHMFLWLGLAVVSGGAVIGVVIANKKKNHNR